jgi:hypothetical protein
MPDVFQLYKPLRNHLSRVPLIESLGVVRAYTQHLQFGTRLPRDIETDPQFLRADRVGKRVFEWELDIMARELLINAVDTENPYGLETLRQWRYFSGAINKLRDLENKIGIPKGMALLELHRLAHRQFPWQKPMVALQRYFRIFDAPALDLIIERKIGIHAKDLYLIGLALTGIYLEKFGLDYPPRIEIAGIDREKLDVFLRHCSADMSVIRAKARELQELNENYAYATNPLRICPLIRVTTAGRDRIIAPIPAFLFRRFTEGIYYEICKEPDFSDAFGHSFEQYVGDVLKRGNRLGQLQIHAERQYMVGKERKDTVDWIVEDTSALMFVESKTKRLRLEAKTEIRTTDMLEKELGKLADFIVQTYKTIRDYRNNHYPELPFRDAKPVYPVVLTLEEWYSFGDMIQAKLDEMVAQRLTMEGLDRSWTEEMPWSVCSVEDFEKLIQVVEKRQIDEVMKRKASSSEFRMWAMWPFLNVQFKIEMQESIDLFPEVLDAIGSK